MIVRLIIAMALVASVAQAQSSQGGGDGGPVSQITVTGARKGEKLPPPAVTIDMQTDDSAIGQFVSVYPDGAFQAKVSGQVTLNCDVDIYGLAEWCEVLSETPEGKNFGRAAMTLRPTFKVPPAMGPNGPVRSMMRIAINFKAPNPQFDTMPTSSSAMPGECGMGGKPCPTSWIKNNPLPRRLITMLDHPTWAQAPSTADWNQAYPAEAGNAEGYAVAHCQVVKFGGLSRCQITKETPTKLGFGNAALLLTRKFQLTPDLAKPRRGEDVWVDVPIRFAPPNRGEERMIDSPKWTYGFDAERAPKVFPPEAVAQGVSTGRGVVLCRVTVGGSLTNCQPQAAEPEGLGFSEAAALLASTMKMNPWSSDGAPVDGASVQIAIRLGLKKPQN